MTHPLELRGLGRAPYTFLGCEHATSRPYPGASEEPAGCCAYCGAEISHAFRVQSADGRIFTLGAECVERADLPKTN